MSAGNTQNSKYCNALPFSFKRQMRLQARVKTYATLKSMNND